MLTEIQNNPNVAKFWWHITNVCQYACSYCPDIAHNGSYKWPEYENSKRLLTDVYNHYLARDKHLILIFSGGEPTACPYLKDLIEHGKNLGSNLTVGIVSNGVRSIKYWESLMPCVDNVILSCHYEYVDLQHFMAVARLLKDKLKTINCCIDPKEYDKCMQMYRQLKSMDLPVLAKPIVSPDSFTETTNFNNEYSAPQKEMLMKEENKSISIKVIRNGKDHKSEHVHNLITNNENKFFGWKCNTGLESVSVFFNQIFKSECRQGGMIGNLQVGYWELDRLDTPQICQKNTCSCISDIAISKVSQ